MVRWEVVSRRIMSSAVEVFIYQNDELRAYMMKPTYEELHKDYMAGLDSNFSQFDGSSSLVGDGAAKERPKESFGPFPISSLADSFTRFAQKFGRFDHEKEIPETVAEKRQSAGVTPPYGCHRTRYINL
ncbi:hypothetical protein TIFTF001_042419 [Ficus carica]|uniref:Uncharacterized protein n=1 Tax=Ficus carica TaxID=3494 RepID=A0AA87ZMT7_FICCA|nr:hypothetical protein TIFTF001_042419 [Ficus carica]